MEGRGECDGGRGAKGDDRSVLVQPPQISNHPHEPSIHHTHHNHFHSPKTVSSALIRGHCLPLHMSAQHPSVQRVESNGCACHQTVFEGEFGNPPPLASIGTSMPDAASVWSHRHDGASTCTPLDIFLFADDQTRVLSFAARLSRPRVHRARSCTEGSAPQ